MLPLAAPCWLVASALIAVGSPDDPSAPTPPAPAIAAEAEARRREAQRAELAALTPPAAPPTAGGLGPVDAWVDAARRQQGAKPQPPCDDRRLIRRLSLDLVGLLPPPEAVEAFVADGSSDKVERLVNRLLADDEAYAEHWMSFWADLLRNDEQTNIDNLRKPITAWLYAALRENRPYDRMVVELLSPGADGPDGYLKGINWRGRVNLSQRPAVQAAQNVAQVFLATSIRCASCHDGFTTPWKLRDAYALAAFFADGPLELARCDKPTGDFAAPRFLYDGLGDVSADADLAARRAAVAQMVTRPKDERFAQVMINRLWDRLMGRPLARPLDEADFAAADSPALVDWLARDFMAHDYDLRHALKQIATSAAYRQQVASGDAADADAAAFAPVPRRLSAEQFLDGLATVTGHWPRPALVNLPIDDSRPARAWRHKVPSPLAAALGRPNREQVVTRRVEDATVLQALEATNGKALAGLLTAGADALLASDWGKLSEPAAALDALFLRAYSRPATTEEHAELDPLVGRPDDRAEVRKEGLEDLLWMVANSPEFQVIR